MKLYGFMVKGIRNMLQKLATGNYDQIHQQTNMFLSECFTDT